MTTKRALQSARAAVAAAVATVVALGVGCKANERRVQNMEAEAQVNTAVVQMHFDEQIRAGAVTGRTVYPYHFRTDLPALTPLGEEHVQMLARALAEQAGEQPIRLNVRRGAVTAELYDARVAEVKQRIGDAGVAVERLVIADGLGGGKGISSKSIADNQRAATGGRNGSTGEVRGGSTGPGTGYQTGMQTQGNR